MLCDTIDTTIVSIPDLVLQRKAWVSPVLGIYNLVHVTLSLCQNGAEPSRCAEGHSKMYKTHSLAGVMSQVLQHLRFKTKEGKVLDLKQRKERF